MAESVEYKVLVRHTVDLQLAVKDNLTHLGARLITAEIITLDQYIEIRNAHRPVNERGADLVGYVQNKVRQDPQHYHTFISALRSDLSQYGSILRKLEQARLPQASERRQPVIPQLPLRRGGGSQLPAQGTCILFVFVLVLGRGVVSAPHLGNSSSLGTALTSISNPTMLIYYLILNFVKSRVCLLSEKFLVLIPIIAYTIGVAAAIKGGWG